MTVAERRVGYVTILDIEGRITVQDGVDVFRAAVCQLLALSQVRIVLNLADVTYIDSTALGEILRLHASVTRRRGGIRLLNVAPRVRELLSTTKLLSVFHLFDDESEAVKNLEAQLL